MQLHLVDLLLEEELSVRGLLGFLLEQIGLLEAWQTNMMDVMELRESLEWFFSFLCGYFVGYFYLVITMVSKMSVGVAATILQDMLGGIIICYIAMLIMVMIATALNAMRTICFYKIFESTVPKRAVIYLLLMMMVPLAGSICLMLCKEKGYLEKEESESFDEQMEEVFAETYDE